MKSIIGCAVFAIALSVSAAWQKVVTIQVASRDSLLQGIMKFGELTGNQMFGTMAAGALSQMPGAELFGPGREKTPMAFCLFVDEEAMKTVLANADKDKKPINSDTLLSYAILYPVAQSREAFVKTHAGCKEQDGVLCVVNDEESDEEEDVSYVVFSKDGKWAALSDNPVQAKASIADIRLVNRPMKGDLVKFVVTPNGMSVFRQIVEQVVKETTKAKTAMDKKDQLNIEDFMEIMKGMSAVVAGLSVDDAGFSVRMSIGTVKGTEFAKCGLKFLGADPLAFASKSSVVTCAYAADCGQRTVDVAELLKVLAKHGIQTESFLKIEELAPNTSVLTVDLPATVAYAKTQTNKLDKASVEPLMNDLVALMGGKPFSMANPEMACAVAIKGYEAAETPAKRFAAILPEAAKKQPYMMQFYSIYSVFKAILPAALATQSKEEQAELAPFLSMLPADGKGGIAVVGWREKDNLKAIFRVSADEVKNLSGFFSAVSAYSMQQAMKKAQQNGMQNAAGKKKAKAKKPEQKAKKPAQKAKKPAQKAK